MKIILLINSIIIMRKLYYSISEVCQLVDEEQHILRYWEKEFPQLKPKKNRGGNRIYSEKDLYLLNSIKKLLRKDNLPLKEAKTKLTDLSTEPVDENIFQEKLTPKTITGKISPESNKDVASVSMSVSDKIGNFTISQTDAKEMLELLKKFAKLLKQNA